MPAYSPSRQVSHGFTLVELMVVVAIIAILANVALPAYTDYVARGKTNEATGALSEMRTALEQWYADNRTYVGYNCISSVQASNADAQNFTLACALAANTYTLTATGKSDKGMSGYSYTVNEANARTSTTPRSTGNCWILKNGGTC